MNLAKLAAIAFFVLPVTFAAMPSQAVPTIFSASGSSPASVQATVDSFRAALGTLNLNVAGSAGAGRREINWDGVPDALSAPNPLAGSFFNTNSPRGVVLATPGTGFQVSATAGVGAVRFDNILAGYSTQFQTFSAQRLFTALGSTITDVTFFVPGSNAPALSRGFGAIFADVDLANVTSLTFFDANNALLDSLFVPNSPNTGLSFLGADYGSPLVSRVRISSGNGALGASEGVVDLVVMDDFIFGEPIPASASPVVEPDTIMLVVTGLLSLGCIVRRRRAAPQWMT